MILFFECPCGNKSGDMAIEYADRAIICLVCGRYKKPGKIYEPADAISRGVVKIWERKRKRIAFERKRTVYEKETF